MPTREIRVLAGTQVIQHLVVTGSDKKDVQTEVSKYIRNQTYNTQKVTIVQK